MKTKPRLTYDNIYYEYLDGTTVCYLFATIRIFGFIAPIKAEGVSQPKNGDRYDREIGEKVALAKAEINAYRTTKKIVEKYYKIGIENQNNLAIMRDKCSRVIEHNINYLKLF